MTTKVSAITIAAQKLCRDPDGIDLTDALALSILNGILGVLHQTLLNVESDLVRGEANQITTVDGTAEYTLTTGTGVDETDIDGAGILEEGIWRDDYPGNPLPRRLKTDLVNSGYDLSDEGQPQFWYPVNMNKIGFYPTPNDEYIYNAYYWTRHTDIAATSEDVPYQGIFDQALKYWLAIEYLQTIGEDISYVSTQLQNAYGTALQAMYNYGTTRRRSSGDLFDIEGV